MGVSPADFESASGMAKTALYINDIACRRFRKDQADSCESALGGAFFAEVVTAARKRP